MKVTISVRGRFHAFYLAQQLQARGHLHRLVTSYPRFEVRRYGLADSKVTTVPAHEAASRAWARLPSRIQRSWNAQAFFCDTFDHAAARQIPADTELYVGWSSFSERGLHRARELGAVTVLERGSAHVEVQRDILREEYERWGVRVELPHPEVVAKEVREYRAADFIAVPSEFARHSFLDKGVDPRKLLKIPYGVNTRAFSACRREDHPFRVIYAGGMTMRKGVHYLLQAFAELGLPKAELWLVGPRSIETNHFFLKYSGTFRHMDAVSQDKLHALYAQSSVFALSSIEEGLAMVLPQAMASALPIICTPNTGGEDLIRDGAEGFVVPIRNVDALKDRISYLYEHPAQAREMGAAARTRVETGFSWNDYGDRVMVEYERMMSAVPHTVEAACG